MIREIKKEEIAELIQKVDELGRYLTNHPEVSGEESNVVGRQLMALGEPADIANMAAYLLSDASKFITGRKFYVDGGRL